NSPPLPSTPGSMKPIIGRCVVPLPTTPSQMPAGYCCVPGGGPTSSPSPPPPQATSAPDRTPARTRDSHRWARGKEAAKARMDGTSGLGAARREGGGAQEEQLARQRGQCNYPIPRAGRLPAPNDLGAATAAAAGPQNGMSSSSSSKPDEEAGGRCAGAGAAA